DLHPLAKNGAPPQTTTGVASTSCSQAELTCAIDTMSRGIVSAREIQKRRDIEASSGSGLPSSVATTGSSAMPQSGQAPGAGWRIDTHPADRIARRRRGGYREGRKRRNPRKGRNRRRRGRRASIALRVLAKLRGAPGAAEKVIPAVVRLARRRVLRIDGHPAD